MKSIKEPSMVEEFFGPEGKLIETFEFEYRSSQEDYARFVDGFIDSDKGVGIVEAATGIGKTCGYLIPCAKRGIKIVVATGTILLQDQVTNKELPRLQELGINCSYAVLKGRMNFLCPIRYAMFDAPLKLLTSDSVEMRHKTKDKVSGKEVFETMKQLREPQFVEWLDTTETYDRAELSFPVPYWKEISAEWDGCPGHGKCQLADVTLDTCPYYKQVGRAEEADILIVSHAMYFANHQLPEGYKFFHPNFTIIDEAHKLVDSISSAYGGYISHTGIKRLLQRVGRYLPSFVNDVTDLAAISWDIFKERKRFPKFSQVRPIHDFLISTSPLVKGLLNDTSLDVTQEVEIDNLYNAMRSMAQKLDEYTNPMSRDIGCVYYELFDSVTRGKRICKNLIDVSGVFNTLYSISDSDTRKVLLTSATLSASGGFKYLMRSLGIEEADSLMLESPFDFGSNCLLYSTPNFADPNSAEFVSMFAERAAELIKFSKGGAFVLFTSWERLESIDLDVPYPVKKQGEMSVSQLVEWFKETPNAVLMGTASFWEGVDVVGKDLRLVIIERVPFSVPTEPVFAARSKLIKSQGGNPFKELALPIATIKLKQGFGRLIRSSSDIGVVAILDRRFAGFKSETGRRSPWAKPVLMSLPPAKRTGSLDVVRDFFEGRQGSEE